MRRSRSGASVQAVYFTITAVVLYVVADRLLQYAESAAGRRFEHRTVVFFAILLALALVTFSLIRIVTSAD